MRNPAFFFVSNTNVLWIFHLFWEVSDRRTDAVFSILGDDPASCSWSNLVLSVHYLKFWSSF